MERVRHPSGGRPQALEPEPFRLPGRGPQLIERKAKPGIQPNADHHARQYASLALTDRWPPAGEPTQAQRAWQHALSILEEIQHLNAGPKALLRDRIRSASVGVHGRGIEEPGCGSG